MGVLLAGLVAGCGGGGGSGGAAGTPAPPPAPAPLESLVPAAPVLGATLLADAAELRPLVAGARYDYDGSQPPQVRYSNTVTVQKNAQGLEETAWSPFAESTSRAIVSVSAGAVTRKEPLDLGLPGTPETITWTELRSPVRVGDQILIFERSKLALGQDTDGDKVNDTADFAAWSRVIGLEDVELPALQRTLSAVRVDVTTALRIHRSTDGKIDAAKLAVQSTWYARGIGVVRQSQSDAGTGAPGALTHDERLRAWDGVTRGLGGFVYTRRDSSPAGFVGYSALAAVPLADRALVLNGLSDDGGEAGIRVSVYDVAGVLLRSTPVPEFKRRVNGPLKLVPCGAGACLLSTLSVDPSFGSFPPYQARLLRLDRDGQPVGPAPGVVLDLGDLDDIGALSVAQDGDGFWLMWVGRTTAAGVLGPLELRVQRFDASGRAVGPRQALDSSSGLLGPQPLSLSATAGVATAVWAVQQFPTYEFKLASIDGSAAPRVSRLFSSPNPVQRYFSAVGVAVSAQAQALFWSEPLFSGEAQLGNSPRGLLLKAPEGAVRAGTGELDAELLPSSWLAGTPAMYLARPGALLLVSSGRGRLSSAALSDVDLLQLTQLSTPLAGALINSAASQLRVPVQDGFSSEVFRPTAAVALADRVLLFGANSATVGLIFTP